MIRNWQALALTVLVLSSPVSATVADINSFFQRPLSCPLRLSGLSTLRDSVQVLAASLGPECAQNSTQALSSLNTSLSNLEGITNTFNTYDKQDSSSETQYAKNVNQLLGSLNVITSNTECVYDIKKRGLLPVVSDVVMSASQLGLLIPSGTGLLVSAGGYVAGSALKIVNELLKDRFNFNRADDRKSFIQLNCAFFDARKNMEEAGIFDFSKESYRKEVATKLRKERAQLLKEQRTRRGQVSKSETDLRDKLKDLAVMKNKNLDPETLRRLEVVSGALATRPGDFAAKWKQVSVLAKEANLLLAGLIQLDLESEQDALLILRQNLTKIIPLLAPDQKAWTANIDEWESLIRGPLMAFMGPVSSALKSELSQLEDDLALSDLASSQKLNQLRTEIKLINDSAWILNQRISTLETKISRLEAPGSKLFSETDEGTSNEVEILENYRKLQRSILGKEGSGYLEHAIKKSYDMEEAVQKQLALFDEAKNGVERCGAAEKLRFAWTQYRLKVQEAHDFVTTNLDLARSSFRVGKERLKSHTEFVLGEIESVALFQQGKEVPEESVGELMKNVLGMQSNVETKLHASKCF